MLKKKSNLEELARMTQNGFAELKQEFGERFEKIEEDIQISRADIRAGFEDLKHVLRPLHETVHDHEAEIYNLRERVERLEKKSGIRK